MIVGDDARTPRREQLGDPRTDPAEPDQADRLAWKSVGSAAADVIGEIVGGAPFACPHVGVALGDSFQQRKHECDGRLGNAEAVGLGRRVAHHDAKLGRGIGVYVVDADRILRDNAQPLRRLHDPPADRSVAYRRAHERHGAARRLDNCIFMRGPG